MSCLKNNKLNYAFIVLSVLVLIYYVFFVEDVSNIPRVIKTISPLWLIFALLCMIFYWYFEAIILHIITKSLHPGQKFRSTVNVTMIGQLFNCLTPFASGGQPMQAYYLVKDGVPLKVATTSLLAKFMVFQIDLILYTTVVLVFKIGFFVNKVSGFAYLAIIGYTVNLLVIGFFFALVYFRKPTVKIIRFFTKILSKIKIVKNPEKFYDRIEDEVKQFYSTFVTVAQKRGLLLKSILLSTVQITFILLIPYAIFNGFGLSAPDSDAFTMIAAGAFVSMVSSFMPLPGASGAAEGSYVIFFSLFFPSGVLGVSTLIWRFITYYLSIFIGSIFTIKTGMFRKNYEIAEKEIES